MTLVLNSWEGKEGTRSYGGGGGQEWLGRLMGRLTVKGSLCKTNATFTSCTKRSTVLSGAG